MDDLLSPAFVSVEDGDETTPLFDANAPVLGQDDTDDSSTVDEILDSGLLDVPLDVEVKSGDTKLNSKGGNGIKENGHHKATNLTEEKDVMLSSLLPVSSPLTVSSTTAEITTTIAATSTPPITPTIATVPENNSKNKKNQIPVPPPLPRPSALNSCNACLQPFTLFNRRHHCRLCGHAFCWRCSEKTALINPTIGGERSLRGGGQVEGCNGHDPSDSGGANGSSNIGATDGHDAVRTASRAPQISRSPQRVCDECYILLEPIQKSLRKTLSNATKFNIIDPSTPRRFFNSPLAFTLGHEIRKAAYTLNNFLPRTRRLGALSDNYSTANNYDLERNGWGGGAGGNGSIFQECGESCKAGNVNLSDLDGVLIPAKLLEEAKGIAVMTVARAGCWVGGEVGTGLVVTRVKNRPEDDGNSGNGGNGGDESSGGTLPPGHGWSAPSALGLFGFSVGPLIGAQLVDHVFLLMTDKAVELLGTPTGSVNLGGDVSLAIGPVGRSVEGSVGATVDENPSESVAGIYTYSFSKGLYAGVSLDGKIISTRHDVNEKFYGGSIDPYDILSGEVERPRAAQPLYDALKRCHVYAQKAGGYASSTAEFRGEQEQRINPLDVRTVRTNPTPPTTVATAMADGMESQRAIADGGPPFVGPGGNMLHRTNSNDCTSNILCQSKQQPPTPSPKHNTTPEDWPF